MVIFMGCVSESKLRLLGIGCKGSKFSNGSKCDFGDSVFRVFKSIISKFIFFEVLFLQFMWDEKGVLFIIEMVELRLWNLIIMDK